MSDQVLRCPTCGNLYMFRTSTSGGENQSACPKCVDEAEKNMSDYLKEQPHE